MTLTEVRYSAIVISLTGGSMCVIDAIKAEPTIADLSWVSVVGFCLAIGGAVVCGITSVIYKRRGGTFMT